MNTDKDKEGERPRVINRPRVPVFLSVFICVHLWLIPASAAEPRRLTRDGDFKQHLAWSPDGSKLLFTRIHQGKMGLWTMNADGGDLKPLLPGQDAPHFDGHWSPDSKKI